MPSPWPTRLPAKTFSLRRSRCLAVNSRPILAHVRTDLRRSATAAIPPAGPRPKPARPARPPVPTAKTRKRL